MPTAGDVKIEIGATEHTLSPAVLRPVGVAYDRRLHRGPYSESWFTSGSGHREPERFTLEAEVISDDGITAAAALVRLWLSRLRDADALEAPWVRLGGIAVISFEARPTPRGYRLRVTLAGASEAAQ